MWKVPNDFPKIKEILMHIFVLFSSTYICDIDTNSGGGGCLAP